MAPPLGGVRYGDFDFETGTKLSVYHVTKEKTKTWFKKVWRAVSLQWRWMVATWPFKIRMYFRSFGQTSQGLGTPVNAK